VRPPRISNNEEESLVAAEVTWVNLEYVPPRSFVCGYCGNQVGSSSGYHRTDNHQKKLPGPYLYVCPFCAGPSFFDGAKQTPGAPFGASVPNVPPAVGALYDEARNCMRVDAYTAAALAARKLLMNVAVSQNAEPDKSFQYYVKYLEDNRHIPSNARVWVDHIRNKGNEATHEIPAITRQDAEDLISFSEMILRLVFDYPARVPGK
jgi:hypothetical protein